MFAGDDESSTVKHRVVRIDNRIFLTFNTDTSYPEHTIDTGTDLSMTNVRTPHEASNRQPYLCLLPANEDYVGAVLGALRALEEDAKHLVKCGTRYRLRSSVISRWLSLEKVLTDLALALLRSSDPPYLPVDYVFPSSPRRLGYLKSYDTIDEANAALSNSRLAFLPLIAHVSWAAVGHRYKSRCKDPSISSSNIDDEWSHVLKHSYGVHEAWLNDLKASPVFNFSYDRVGVVINDPTAWAYFDRLHVLIHCNVPIWLAWENNSILTGSNTWPTHVLRYFRISDNEMDAKTTEYHNRRVDVKSSIVCSGKIISTERHSYSNVQVLRARLSPERNGIFEWIRSREKKIAQASQHASEERKAQWAERQRTARDMKCPGKAGAILYRWLRDDEGAPKRQRVVRDDAQIVWACFAPSQRWFNYVSNEWDLCEELDPTVTPTESVPDVIPEDNLDPHADDAFSAKLARADETACSTSSGLCPVPAIDLTRIVDNIPSMTDEADECILSYVPFRVLTVSFGFSGHSDMTYPRMDNKPIKFDKLLRILGVALDDNVSSAIPTGLEASCLRYVTALADFAHPDKNDTAFPDAQCDMSPNNPLRLDWFSSSISIRKEEVDGNVLYFLQHEADSSYDWDLVVTDACSALQAVRLNPYSLSELVQEFVHSRTPFFTFKEVECEVPRPQNRSPRNEHMPDRIGLGRRREGHIFDKSDFIAYEAMRTRLLADNRIARAAIKRGGILSRLVSSVVDCYAVLDGPTSIGMENCIWFSVEEAGRTRNFFDDGISNEEIAIIVGLYSMEGNLSYSSKLTLV